MKKYILILIAILFLATIYWAWQQYFINAKPVTEVIKPEIKETPISESAQAKTWNVEIKDGAFSPSTLKIKKGDTVTWTNRSTSPSWPASAIHPTHTLYPTTGGCIGSTFDACRGLSQGESWSFKFDAIGSWKYHDHLNPSVKGIIEVEE